jgi:hypothetical protein
MPTTGSSWLFVAFHSAGAGCTRATGVFEMKHMADKFLKN